MDKPRFDGWMTPDDPMPPYCFWCADSGHTYATRPDRDVATATASTQPSRDTWCRVHRVLDACPEHCWRCHGYFHDRSDCDTADATDQGTPMPMALRSEYTRRLALKETTR